MNESTDRRPEWLRSWSIRGPVAPIADDNTPESWELPSKAMRWTPEFPVPLDRTAPDTDPTPSDEEF